MKTKFIGIIRSVVFQGGWIYLLGDFKT